MSDQWEFFPRQMGDHVAFVFVNTGIADHLEDVGRTSQVLVRVTLKNPREDGLTSEEEFDSLAALEDAFENYCETRAATVVGRVTVAGFRDFVVYADDGSKVEHGLRTIAADEHGYEVECLVREDPEFEVYWEHLYPTPVEQQLIQNSQLLAALEEHGDDGAVPRRIDHYISFAEAATRSQFEKRIESEGFRVDGRLDPTEDEDGFTLRISREDPADFESINEVTTTLFRLAQEFAGAYDGWETPVVSDD